MKNIKTVLIVILLILALYFFSNSHYLFSIISLVLALVVTLQQMNISKKRHNKEDEIKEKFLSKVLKEKFGEYSYIKKDGLCFNDFSHALMAPPIGQYASNDTLKFTYKNRAILVSDVALYHASSSNKGGSYAPLPMFIGTFIRIKLDNSRHILINNLAGIDLAPKKLYKTNNELFNTIYRVLLENESDFDLSDEVLEKMISLYNKFQANLYFHFVDDFLYIGLSDGSDTYSLSNYDNLEEVDKIKKDFKKQLEDILELIDVVDFL